MRRERIATLLIGLALLGWIAWDTDADPRRLARGLQWMFDFVRRLLPPDLSVLPAAVAGAVKTVEIALLGTAVQYVLWEFGSFNPLDLPDLEVLELVAFH